jgi:putative peptidoglycan lipid II flippase
MKVYFCAISMLKTESYSKAIIYSTSLNIMAKGLYFLNTLIIAFFFGTSVSTDIYFFVISMAILITTGMLNGIDGIILIPRAMQLREKEGDAASRFFLNFFLLLYFFIGVIIFLVAIASPVLFYSSFSKFGSLALQQNQNLLYAGAALIFFQLLNNFSGAILSSYKYFTVIIITSLITSSLSIGATIFFHQQLGIVGTLAAVATSYGISFLFLLGIMKFKLQWQFSKFTFIKSKELWGNICLFQLNLLPVWLRNYITLFLLSGLGVGIVSSVNLAQQAAGIIDTLIIAQVLSVAGIKFNELYAKNELHLLDELLLKIAGFLFIILMPVVVIIFFYNENITTLVFKRGNMVANSISTVAYCLKYLIILSPLMLLNSICTRIFAAAQMVKYGLIYSISAHTIFLLLVIVLTNWLQLKGYLYAMIAGYSIIVFFFYLLFKAQLKQIDFVQVLQFGLKQLAINLIIAAPVFFTFKKLTGINYIVLLFIAAFIQVAVVGIINRKQLHFSALTNLLGEFRNKKDAQ